MSTENTNPLSEVPDENLARLVQVGRDLWDRAEPGFREHRTHEYLVERFTGLGFEVETFDGMPGLKARVAGTEPRLAVIADMDGLPIPGDPEGSYIHSCGHHMQTTALVGAAMLLKAKNPEILKEIAFVAVPAEEYIDFEDRKSLVDSGSISRMSGKQELLERGFFDAFDRVVSTHAAGFQDPAFISSILGMGGFDVLRFYFRGIAAHAGAAPHKGVNAQNAASLFLQACAFLRETFYEEDHIRIHPVITMAPGQSVNIIPEDVQAETYVRGANPEAIERSAAKLIAAAEGAAMAIGCTVDVEKIPGYAPFKADLTMHEALRKEVEGMGIPFIEEGYATPSSDMGDVSQHRPSVMLGLPGVNGLFHNPEFKVTNEEMAYGLPALVLSRYLPAVLKLG